jgi:phage terminase small subunit
MGTTLIKNRQNGSSLNGLTSNQRAFVLELLADNLFNPTDAARRVGYKQPASAANQLLKNKKVQAALGKAQREREERCQLKADDVLNYLRTALFFNPLRFFTPTKDGKLEIMNPEEVPEEIGRLIEKYSLKHKENEDGSTQTTIVVETLSKSVALGLAMKHTTVDKADEEKLNLWQGIMDNLGKPQPDLVEEKIRQAALPDPLKKKE